MTDDSIARGPGSSRVLLEDGQMRILQSSGYADVEAARLATPTTNYRLASVSKQFTAFAMLQAAAAGRLALETPLSSFFGSAPIAWQAIRIHELLIHSSGIVDYEDLIPADATAQLHDADVLALVSRQPELYFAPGTTFRYSNTGYCLLALILERIYGQPFATILHEQIFAPLAMAGTVAYQPQGSPVSARAYGYSFAGEHVVRSDQSITSATLGDGGIYSSVLDLARWDAALADQLLLPTALHTAIVTPQITTPTGEAYGYGWFLSQLQGERIAYHTGETIGFRNAIIRSLERRRTAIVLANRNDATALAEAQQLFATRPSP